MDSENSKHTIHIDVLNRHTIVIENNEEGDKSSCFFYEEYEIAKDIAKNILKSQDDKKNSEYKKEYNIQEINNIIAFTGKRGSGKTSAMCSFGKILEDKGIENFSFSCLPLVDPSFFTDNKNILFTIMSSIYKIVKERINKTDKGCDRSVVVELDKIFKHIGQLDFRKKESYNIEYLNELGTAVGLKEEIHGLIDKYLNTCTDHKNRLVIMIDDLDMNTDYAAMMLEQIRKFLQQDNLLILMATNIDQLQHELEEFYSRSYKETHRENLMLKDDIEDTATKYLLKIMPASRRISVDNAAKRLIHTNVEFENIDKSNESHKKCSQTYINEPLQKVILTMVWEKTRLLFVPPADDVLHPLIPTNLRDLMQLIYMLIDMKSINTKKEGGETDDFSKLFCDRKAHDICRENFKKFKYYIMNNWIPNNVTFEEESVFENIPQEITKINKHLINSINVVGTKNKKRLMSKEVDLEQIQRNSDVTIDRDIYTMVSPNDPKFPKANKISDIFNYPSNYSYGDLLLLIDKYETYFESVEDNHFIDAVKIYYSLLLFETMFFERGASYDKNDFNKDLDELVIPIQRLIGGTVYYPNYFEIITSKEFKQKEFNDAKRPFYHSFDIKNNNSLKEINGLFFVLYYGDIRPERYYSKHVYDTTYNSDSDVNGDTLATFDILSLFNNMLNPLHTLKRFDKGRSDEQEEEELTRQIESLKGWNDICKIDESDIPEYANTLLPIYSVDMMLIYLRNQYDYDEYIVEKNKDERSEKSGNEIILSEELDNQVFKNKCLYIGIFKDKIKDSDRKKLNKYFTAIKDISNGKSGNNCDENGKESCYKCIYMNDESSGGENLLCYSNLPHDKPNIEIFRNKALNEIIKVYQGRREDLDKLIKKIKMCDTVAETMKCVVTELYYNEIKECVIRKPIQEEIRNPKFIEAYYAKLKKLTENAIGYMSIDIDKSILNTYDNIYETGVKVFINDKVDINKTGDNQN